jgi:hypothetical protein
MWRWATRKVPHRGTQLPLQAAAALGSIVNAVARSSPIEFGCLARSLALLSMLSRRGALAQLRIGVAAQSNQLRAHAWVECNGVPVNDDAGISERFTPLSGSF